MADNTPNGNESQGAYNAMRSSLDEKLAHYESAQRQYESWSAPTPANLERKRAFIDETATEASQGVKKEQRREPDYDYPAAREAIRDWQHEHNDAVKQQIRDVSQVPWDVSDGKTTRGPVPAAQLSKQEIVAEVRELHSHFKELESEYKAAPASQRTHLREEMQPLVDRERALRSEYVGRASQELSQDPVPDQVGYSR